MVVLCTGCRDELSMVPGRDLGELLRESGRGVEVGGEEKEVVDGDGGMEREGEGMPSVVVWGAEGEDEDGYDPDAYDPYRTRA